MMYVLAFLASFLFVFLKAWQQQSVTNKLYKWILPTSMCMACCEVFVVVQAAKNGYGWVVLPIGIGAGLGAMLSMYLHTWLMDFRRKVDGK